MNTIIRSLILDYTYQCSSWQSRHITLEESELPVHHFVSAFILSGLIDILVVHMIAKEYMKSY
jgi:hypothetical protein